MARVSQVIVLAEDERHQRFVRSYLKLIGMGEAIRNEALPSGRGSGEQWVRERYASAVKAYRWRSSRAETALVSVIDADAGDSSRRVRQLQEGLERAGLEPRTADERIVHLIPRQNIETWILNLIGHEVDEETDYRRTPEVDDLIHSAAQTLFEWTRPNAVIPAHCTSSLRSAFPELRRLEPVQRFTQ